MNQKAINYLLAIGALLGLFWSGASAWFDLRYRVTRLEEK